MKNLAALIWLLFLNIVSYQALICQTNIDLNTSVYSSSWSDEHSLPDRPKHQGYSVGLDVVIHDKGILFMPGFYFQKTSLVASKLEWNKPYKKNIGIRNIKLPMQLGFYFIKSKWLDLKMHGGVAINYEMDVDSNSKVLDEDLTQIRFGSILGISAKIFFLTVHARYENGWSKIFLPVNPSGILNASREKVFSIGLGIYL